MKEIMIGQTIIRKRKEKGITQDDLASFIGVTKASVSKWETGHSYPDIVFLPQLAGYFDISVDELLSYEPQMTNDDICKLSTELLKEFASKPFDEVMNRCRDIAKEYFSCYPLLYQIGTLFLNYSATLSSEEKKAAIVTEAMALFVRVKNLCSSIDLKLLALHCEAACEIKLGHPNEVIALLEEENRPFSFQPSIAVMLSQSYQKLGRLQEAKMTLQSKIFDSIFMFFYDIPSYLALYSDDKEHFEEACQRTMDLIEIFNAKTVLPAATLSFYLAAAEGHLTIGNTDKSLTMLETYTNIITSSIQPFAPKKDRFFTLIEEFQGKALEEVPFGIPDLQCDEQSLKQIMMDAIIENPAFIALASEPRFDILLQKLKSAQMP